MLFPPIPRVREPELMDDPALTASDHLRALVALGTINTLSLTAAQLTGGEDGCGRAIDRTKISLGGTGTRH